MEEAIRIYGLEPGQWIELEWPPTAGLWDPGNVYATEFEPCEAHAEPDDAGAWDDCPDCQDSVREVIERMAQWKWTTELRIYQIGFDAGGNERDEEVYSDNAFEVAIIEQDPREILIGSPGEGRQW
ncbi:hypothetical protein [Candidatus Mycobacterium methanotrophicum]|uniref:Uncharacterized protein n=1 Tax=Candidatus Mycobacterium methanotrophicum TaxID=2943498 RepID=A0ABY4QH49_9MYCO|nr:hypothetical protein [Candidatus Mycobacterium methanotrophicum]UQX10184.1 hypothetical protein M5I08_18635 [Candidatus Mycobacterium methanotrophicum]